MDLPDKCISTSEWVSKGDNEEYDPCFCKKCGGYALESHIGEYYYEVLSDYCPHCGATMINPD